jgi:hypothetical protein
MPQRKVYHVTPTEKGWAAKAAGGERASATGATKAEVVAAAKALAKNVPLGQVVVHKSDGTIQTEHTYGKDPERSAG